MELLSIITSTEEDPSENYPPMGEPDRAMIIAIDCDNFHVLAHTGRFFHAQINCAGVNGEEIGIERSADLEPGYYVFDGGDTWESRDWETGYIDDYGIGGTWRKPTRADFDEFGVPLPLELNTKAA